MITAPFFRTYGESFRLPDQATPRQVANFLITLRDLLPQLDRDVAAQLAAHSSTVDGSDRAVSRATVHEAVVAYLVSLMACAVIEARAGVPCFRAHLAGLVPELAILDAYRPDPELASALKAAFAPSMGFPTSIAMAGDVFQQGLTLEERKRFGQYYTPRAMAEHLLDQAGYHPDPRLLTMRVLDVATGFGVFLASAAARLAHTGRQASMDDCALNTCLGQALYGYDVQPFAIIATKIYVLLSVVEELDLHGLRLMRFVADLRLPNVLCVDTLRQEFDVPDVERPHLVLGNPPYGVCSPYPYRARYGQVLEGKANLYQLFTFFALRRVAAGGVVALLVPESLRAGRTFGRLRRSLAVGAHLVAVTDFHARAALFAEVEQGVMVLVVRKGRPTPGSVVRVVQVANLAALPAAVPFCVPRVQAQGRRPKGYVLPKGASSADYALISRLQRLPVASHIALEAHTGPLVWNRHKGELQPDAASGYLPLLYAHSVARYGFAFPPVRNNVVRQRLLYGDPVGHAGGFARSGEVVLVQRTTARDQARRLIAATLPTSFRDRHPFYLIENHVTYIDQATCDGSAVPLCYVLGLLNAKLFNFLFASISGTVAVSAWELMNLPLLFVANAGLEQAVYRRLELAGREATAAEADIDGIVYELYGLSGAERVLVEEFHSYSHGGTGRRINRSTSM